MDIRDNIKSYIEHRGFIQLAIAQKSGLTPAQLSNVLHKKRCLEANELFAICDAMEIAPGELRLFELDEDKAS